MEHGKSIACASIWMCLYLRRGDVRPFSNSNQLMLEHIYAHWNCNECFQAIGKLKCICICICMCTWRDSTGPSLCKLNRKTKNGQNWAQVVRTTDGRMDSDSGFCPTIRSSKWFKIEQIIHPYSPCSFQFIELLGSTREFSMSSFISNTNTRIPHFYMTLAYYRQCNFALNNYGAYVSAPLLIRPDRIAVICFSYEILLFHMKKRLFLIKPIRVKLKLVRIIWNKWKIQLCSMKW